MKNSISVIGEPVSDPMLGCGFILCLIGIIGLFSLVYILFKINIIILISVYSITILIIGITLIVLCYKAENHGNKV
jgi:hypothetical protein